MLNRTIKKRFQPWLAMCKSGELDCQGKKGEITKAGVGIMLGRVTEWKKYVRRIKDCYRCPVFKRKTKACGYLKVEDQTFGCGCYMPFKALQRNAKCFLDEHAPGQSSFGWKEETNGK